MAAKPRKRWPWGSLIAAVLFFAIAVAVLKFVPGSPINTSHQTTVPTPGAVTLPATAPLPTATPAPTATIGPSTTVTPGASPSTTP
jgi:hypothetical protein